MSERHLFVKKKKTILYSDITKLLNEKRYYGITINIPLNRKSDNEADYNFLMELNTYLENEQILIINFSDSFNVNIM